jgi:hypothetical protein
MIAESLALARSHELSAVFSDEELGLSAESEKKLPPIMRD